MIKAVPPETKELTFSQSGYFQMLSSYVRFVRLQGVPGYLPGFRQPVVLVEFQLLAPVPTPLLQTFVKELAQIFGALPSPEHIPGLKRFPGLAYVGLAVQALLKSAGWPVLSSLSVVKHKASAGDSIHLAFPSLHSCENGVEMALQGVLSLFYATAAEDGLPEAREALAEHAENLKNMAPQGMNTIRFLEAADAQGIPWRRIVGNLYQFGWGSRARWLDSSFSDQTPTIAARLVRDKRSAVAVLQQAGIPVSKYFNVKTEQDALTAAESLGYPVVVKPADLDGGQGVFAFLKTPFEVSKALGAASALSRNVIVEKHFVGNDYRLQVFQGEVYWATHRLPAGVTGDGVHCTRQLVDIANADPSRGPPGSPLLKWIVLDEEADNWLARQSLTLDAVPEKGKFVRLRGAANVASGGTIEPVLDVAHPDNLALAARAANILRLDIAGIDLLISDIRRSWREVGAIICEVNSQPQMAPHLPAKLLPRLVSEQGRIPVIVVFGEDAASVCNGMYEELALLRKGFGLAGARGAWISGLQVAVGPMDSFQAGQCLLCDPSLSLLALHVEDARFLQLGAPFDRIDHLILVGPLQKAGKADWQTSLALAGWLSGVSKNTWLLDDSPQWRHPQVRKMGLPSKCVDVRAILDKLIQDIQY